MFEKQEEEYKIEIQSLVRELQHVKKKFFLQVAIDELVTAAYLSEFINLITSRVHDSVLSYKRS